LGSGLLLFKYSRDFEREADEEAIRRLNTLKVSALPLADFMESVSSDLKIDFTWLSTHPNPSKRSTFFRQNTHYPNPGQSKEWDSIKERCSE
jgi:predicted Zn-dependent protease